MKIKTSELKNRAGGDFPTRKDGLRETGSRRHPEARVFSFKSQKKIIKSNRIMSFLNSRGWNEHIQLLFLELM